MYEINLILFIVFFLVAQPEPFDRLKALQEEAPLHQYHWYKENEGRTFRVREFHENHCIVMENPNAVNPTVAMVDTLEFWAVGTALTPITRQRYMYHPRCCGFKEYKEKWYYNPILTCSPCPCK